MIRKLEGMEKTIPAPLADALRACKRHLLTAALFSALVNVLYLAPTIYMMQVYDRVMASGSITTLMLITIVLGVSLITLTLLDNLRSRLLVRAGLRLDRILAGQVLSRLMARLRGPGAPRISQAMREFDTFRQGITGPGMLALFDAPWTPIYLAFAFMLHPVLGMLTLGGGVILFALALLNERTTKPRLQRASEASAVAYVSQDGVAANGEVVRALGMRNAMVTKQLSERRLATDLQAEAQFVGGRYSGAIKFVRLFLQSLALGTGAWLAVERQISAGSVIAASVLMSRALAPIEQLVGSWSGVVQARVAFNTLVSLFTQIPDEPVRTQLPAPKGLIQLEHVAVRAPGSDAFILKNVSLAIQPGEAVGVIGPSGAGKTTLSRVIAGATTPDYGSLRVDGADTRDWDQERLGRHFGYLPQDSVLFAGSVRDNISRFEAWHLADPSDIDAHVVAAAQAAGAHEMILRLPQGYDTVLGPGGRGVSAGQGQRIALARALYRDPAVLVLDEPNSHLDAEGEAALMRALNAAKQRGASVFIVAHRTGVLASTDKLVVLRDGAVEFFGPREEVVAKLSQREAALPSRQTKPQTPVAAAGTA
jgi:ATP-binding cassette subfamily C protein